MNLFLSQFHWIKIDKLLFPDEGAPNSAAVMSVIFDHCLPKLVCQLYSLKPEDLEKLSDQEQHLMNMIG